MTLAFAYVENNPLELSTDYPYVFAQTKAGSCTYNANKGTGSISTYKNVPQNKNSEGVISSAPMKNALKIGPVSVGVAASSNAFQQYTSGILTNEKGCGT